jgi:hypothetical protein
MFSISGVNEEASRKFISSFYHSLTLGADHSDHSFAGKICLYSHELPYALTCHVMPGMCSFSFYLVELCEEAATPGGLNEQVIH